MIIHLAADNTSMSTESDEQSAREEARESLLSGGERVAKGRQRGKNEVEDDEA
jgi:hypothetical protein